MKKVLTLCAIIIASSFLSGCALFAPYQAPVVPPTGFIVTSIKAPLDVDMDETVMGSRRGVSEVSTILGLVSVGDASIRAAANNGRISTVTSADYEYFSVLGIYQRFGTIVYGD